MDKNRIAQPGQIRKLAHNIWTVFGHVVTFGALFSPGGLYWCANCRSAECEHTRAVDAKWQAGQDSAETILVNAGGEFWGVLEVGR